MTPTESLLMRRIYELERQLPNRNYAKDHSFEEWVEYQLSITTLERSGCQ